MYREFLRAMDLTNKKERQETLHKLISRLPAVNHAVFERLIFHLARVAQHEHINKMGPSNLAIIFAPCLLRGKEGKKLSDPKDMLKDIGKQSNCLEAIITEQVEKLTATIRGIRTLTSFARETETKLSLLASLAESSESAGSTPSATLKSSKQSGDAKVKTERKGLSAEERNILANTLEEIERERVELAVNLPKLEPFLSRSEDERTADSDHWTPSPSPSPSPLVVSAFSTGTQSQRTFSPITEHPLPQERLPLSGSRREKDLSVTPPPTLRLSPEMEGILPVLPTSGPVLASLTKNRVSHRPTVRPPTGHTPAASTSPASVTCSEGEGVEAEVDGLGKEPGDPFQDDETFSVDEEEEGLFIETTV